MQRLSFMVGFFLTLLALLSAADIVAAQSLSGTPAPVQFTVAPENPGPNAPVDISIAGVGSFLGNATITWTENGKTVLSGPGERELTFQTGPLGKPVTISVRIDSPDVGTITHTWTFNPSRIDLIWEGATSVPPFYEGRALPSAGSQVTVLAFPEVMHGGSLVSTDNLSFQWKIDGTPVPEQSGLGRNTLTFTANQLHQSADVTVDVQENNASVGEGEAIIPFVTPFITLYTHDPLRGTLYSDALTGTYNLPSIEATLHAEPYFFSQNSFANNSLSFDWQLNGQDIIGPDTAQGELTVRQTGGKGSASLTVALQNSDPTKLLQAAQTALTISFGNTTSSSVFGL